MTYDELQKALDYYEDVTKGLKLTSEFGAVLDAAKAHLKTLPREVEVVGWATVNLAGRVTGTFTTEIKAANLCCRDEHVVKLTGKYPVQP